MAFFRALESCQPVHRRLFSDPLASGFLSGGLRALAATAHLPGLRSLLPRLVDRRNPGPRVSALVRTRMIDDQLSRGLTDGAAQIVILGAGYDSRAYRVAQAEAARVYEVDHPATQAVKRRGLVRALGAEPANVVWVGVDFLREDFGSALLDAGYSASAATFFIWEGVTNYLDAGSVESTFRWVSGHSAPGSRVSFTYVDRGLLDGSVPFGGSERWLAAVQRAGEPFTFGLVPAELESYLAGTGLCLLSDESTAQALARLQGRWPVPPAFYHVALAEVASAASA